MLIDCITGLPVFELTTTADVSDSTVALNILSQTNSLLPINECTFIADKAYDVKEIYNTVKNVYNGDCAIPLNKRNTKNPKKLPSGHPICEAGLAMNKDGKISEDGKTRQKYCCPFRQSKTSACPCNHKNWNNGKKNKGCTKYITVPDDYRLSIDRDCISFKKIYALRTEAERYNSRFKQTGQERLWVHSMNAAKNLNTIAHIALSSLTTFNKSTENLGIVPLPLLPCNDKKLYPTGWLEAVAACKGVKDLRPAIAWSKFCSTYTNPVQTTTSMRDEDVELVKKLATGNICYSNYGFASTSTDVNTIVTEIESKLIKGNNVATVLSDYRQPVQNCIDSAIH